MYKECYRSIDVGVANDLRREEGLARSRTEETSHDTVGQVHFVRHFTHSHSNFADIWFNLGRAVQVPMKVRAIVAL